MRKALLAIGIGLAAVVAAVGLYVALAASIFSSPNPTKIFQAHRNDFILVAGRRTSDFAVDDDAGYQAALERLQTAGVTRIARRGKCLAFYLASLPPDSNYELLYCPDGFHDLPIAEVAGPPNDLLELKRVSDDYRWYYWIVY